MLKRAEKFVTFNEMFSFSTLIFYFSVFHWCDGLVQGPVFIYEPPHDVTFLNTKGVTLDCSAHGEPQPSVVWMNSQSTVVSDIFGIRSVHRNGSLTFHPFDSARYRQDVHAMIYKCRVKNAYGTILSRDVHVRAAVEQRYQVQVYNDYVIRGNIGVLKCQVPSYVKDYVAVTSWLRDDGYAIERTTNSEKYTALPNGVLYIHDVQDKDGANAYRCKTRHKLTGHETVSDTSGRLIITDPRNSIPARITNHDLNIEGKAENPVYIPCAAQGFPIPTYSWFRRIGDDMISLKQDNRIKTYSGVLIINNANINDSNTYTCIAKNGVGEQKVSSKVVVSEALSVYIEPQKLLVDSGKSASLKCLVTGYPRNEIFWLKNGKLLIESIRVKITKNNELQIETVGRVDEGMYQCMVKNSRDFAQGTAQLILGDVSPAITQIFQTKSIRPGVRLSLRCAATGNPRPLFRWFLDGKPLHNLGNRRISHSHNLLGDGTIVSDLVIKGVQESDGGLYTCQAFNKAGKSEHLARINVYGLPSVRKMNNVSVVAGENLYLNCYVYGYPIHRIFWLKDGIKLMNSRKIELFSNGTLLIRETNSLRDEGKYTCKAENKDLKSSEQSIWVKLIVKPVLQEIADKSVKEETRATLSCSLSEGDQPITFSWFKDGYPLPPSLGLTETKLPMMSVLDIPMVHFVHVGNYTCLASNPGGSANRTARVRVLVEPSWNIIPKDTVGISGGNLSLHCSASGFPLPVITWHKKNNSADSWIPLFEGEGILLLKNGTLVIHNLSRSDKDEYMCIADNNVGGKIRSKTSVVIGVPPKVLIYRRKFITKLEERLELSCSIIAEQDFTSYWFREIDNAEVEILEKDKRFEIRTENGIRSKTILRIKEIQIEDSTKFICKAENKFGARNQSMVVIVQRPPDAPTEVKLTKTSPNSIRLTWNAPKNGYSLIKKYVAQLIENDNEDWSVGGGRNHSIERFFTTTVISEIGVDVDYSIRLFAINEIGTSHPSDVIRFTLLKNGSLVLQSSRKQEREETSSNLITYAVSFTVAASFLLLFGFLLIYYSRKKIRQFKKKSKEKCSNSPDVINSTNAKLSEDNGYYGDLHSSETQILNSRHYQSNYHDYNKPDANPVYYATSAGCYTEVSPYATFHINDQHKSINEMEMSTFSKKRISTEIS